ncbi:uncharacterized protein LACBIDRAFT_310382 [Laccaria bicolor S238N-H82]|uniref:Predicted protein n=1 Tax=Laccaria bicolor (strain S238N-H82 / ATCC MYA-4686) TaxID=486041 RepID=B0DU85_LACBS|nr:uncharacterized protein LACBIDRAFT_310382 [Laccaria bicolor S238N-H82]EDR01859.1 predicted protein [Laccaria bicolor S238N-H82]|eukprot:XP_001887469.1 predicted protein [Laccaria bicolor S238N-H82]
MFGGLSFRRLPLIIFADITLVSCVQAWYYFTHQNDRWHLKLLVSAVMMFDTAHQALIMNTVYAYVISNWGNMSILGELVPTLLIEVLFNGLTAFLVQSFLATRIWHLSNRNIWITGLISFLVLGEFGCILAYTAISLQYKTFVQLTELKTLSITVNVLAAAGDVLIAGTLCTILHFSRTGFHRTDTIINKLIIFSVNTGLITSLCAIASLVSILAAGQTFIYIAFFFCMGRLYTNSLLATLNARKGIRQASDAMHSTNPSESHAVSLNPLSGLNPNTVSNGKQQANISIKIDTQTEFATDSGDDMKNPQRAPIISGKRDSEGKTFKYCS